MPPPAIPVCSTCKFFAAAPVPLARTVPLGENESAVPVTIGQTTNVCRKNPPVSFPLILTGQLTFTSAYPTVQTDDWCGLYEKL